jgi:hypothetical protein
MKRSAGTLLGCLILGTAAFAGEARFRVKLDYATEATCEVK